MASIANELQGIRHEVVGKEELSAAIKVDEQAEGMRSGTSYPNNLAAMLQAIKGMEEEEHGPCYQTNLRHRVRRVIICCLEEEASLRASRSPVRHAPCDTGSASRTRPSSQACVSYLKAQQLYITQWMPKFDWLLLEKNEDGLPILRCSICVEHGKDDAKFGRNGTGRRDLQLGSMRCHELSGRHDESMKTQWTLMAEIEKQKRLDDFANTDKEGAWLTRLMRGVEFICDHDAPIAMFPKLIEFLAEEGVADVPLQAYGVYITQ
ncbi:unnamed protein product [Closterium sp. Naga37s-1]|nr:unnamed protein product [Closterium sp. Naga37s-1]